MSLRISGEEAYETYSRLELRKSKEISASFKNVSTILANFHPGFRVEIKPKPPDNVS